MKSKLRAFLYGLFALLIELALLYPASLLDKEIDWQIRVHFGSDSEWIFWVARAVVWISIIVGPLAAYLVGHHWLEGRRRAARLRDSLAEASSSTTVRLAGRKEWSAFQADAVVRLAVPDAIAAVDKTRGLLRLKAIGPYQDAAIDLAHIVGLEWQEGEARKPRDRQSVFRRFDPKYRTLVEHPRIRLELATEGKEPVLEYFLLSDPKERKSFRSFFDTLQHAARKQRSAKLVPTARLLEALPLQGSKHGFGWI